MTNIDINKYYNSKRKRIFDLSLSIVLIFIFIPIFTVISFLIFFDDGFPVIFKQKRTGKNGKEFRLFKFRTMKKGSWKLQKKLISINEAPYPMFKIKDDPRFTHIGKKLSQLGLDELPQLINILKGEMSFIGPRPLPTNEALKLDHSWNFRHKVKPGILSKWAISNKRHLSLKEWKSLDIIGLKNGSIKSDVLLIIETTKVIFFKH